MSSRHRQTRGQTRRQTQAIRGTSFPWLAALGASVLGLAMVGTLAYAVVNTGSAAPDPLRDADASIQGISVADKPPSQGHKSGPLKYDQTPSWGGEHNGTWSTCTGSVYTEQVPQEHAAHSMEHGAAWVTYSPDLPPDQVKTLTELVKDADYRLLSPFPGLASKVSVQAWGRQLKLDSAKDPRLEKFLDAFSNGPQAPEKGATCSGGTMATGTAPQDRPQG